MRCYGLNVCITSKVVCVHICNTNTLSKRIVSLRPIWDTYSDSVSKTDGHTWKPNPKGDILGGRTIGILLGHEFGALVKGISVL
jgi:hypothetical protein